MKDVLVGAVYVIVTVFVFCLGAYSHEGDIQRACKENGKTGYSTWRGELKCSPIDDESNS